MNFNLLKIKELKLYTLITLIICFFFSCSSGPTTRGTGLPKPVRGVLTQQGNIPLINTNFNVEVINDNNIASEIINTRTDENGNYSFEVNQENVSSLLYTVDLENEVQSQTIVLTELNGDSTTIIDINATPTEEDNPNIIDLRESRESDGNNNPASSNQSETENKNEDIENISDSNNVEPTPVTRRPTPTGKPNSIPEQPPISQPIPPTFTPIPTATPTAENTLPEAPPNENIQPSNSGLISYWSFDSTTGEQFPDLVGNNNLTIRDGVSLSPGISGNASDFDGVRGRLLTDNISINNSNITITTRIFVRDNVSDTRIISKADGERASRHDWAIGVLNRSLRIRLTVDGETRTESIAEFKIENNSWINVAVTWNGTNISAYKNGILVKRLRWSGNSLGSNSERKVGVGGQPLGAGSKFFNGRIDELRIYNRALSQNEIETLTR